MYSGSDNYLPSQFNTTTPFPIGFRREVIQTSEEVVFTTYPSFLIALQRFRETLRADEYLDDNLEFLIDELMQKTRELIDPDKMFEDDEFPWNFPEVEFNG